MGLRDRLRSNRTPEDAFADEVKKAIPGLLAVQKVERVPDDFALQITHRGGRPTTMFLQNIFIEASRLEGAERDERIRRAILAMAPTDKPTIWADAKSKLLPALRSVSWVAASTISGKRVVQRPFAPFVSLLIAIDAEHAMTFATDDDRAQWDVPADLLFDTAFANLQAAGPEVTAHVGPLFVEVLGPDGYASSWLALPPALERFGADLDGGYVVVAPSRDALRLIAAGDRTQLMTLLEQGLDDYVNAPRQLSPVPYVVRQNEIETWEPTPDDAARALVDKLQRVLALREYGEQHRVLTDLYEKGGVDVFVANYTLQQRDDGTVWSWSAWVRGVTDGLLPETDFVNLGDAETKESLWLRWADVVRIAGAHLASEPDFSPPRWRVHDWPPDDVVDQLRRLVVEPGAR